MNQIIIRTEKDAQNLEVKMAQVQIEYLPFAISTLVTLINQLVIDPIQEIMRNAGVSEKVIHTTYLDTQAEKRGETITFAIKSTYISDTGFPVARMIEYGRKAYFVKLKYKKFLSWIKNGIRYFSKGHKIPAKRALNAIFDSIRRGQPRVQKALNHKTKIWINETLHN